MAAYTAGVMTHVTCRLTANNRDQLRNPTLGNRVWATFFNITAISLPFFLNINQRHRSILGNSHGIAFKFPIYMYVPTDVSGVSSA